MRRREFLAASPLATDSTGATHRRVDFAQQKDNY